MTMTIASAHRSSIARKGWNLDDAMAIDAVEPAPAGPLICQPSAACGEGFYTDLAGTQMPMVQMAGVYFGDPILIYAREEHKDALDALRRGSHLFASIEARSLGYRVFKDHRPSQQCFIVADDAVIRDL